MFRRKAPSPDKLRERLETTLNDEPVEGVRISGGGDVTLVVATTEDDADTRDTLRQRIEALATAIKGVKSVRIVMTAERAPAPAEPSAAPPPPPSGQRRVRKGARLSDEALAQSQPGSAQSVASVPGISRILVVASAKGGVGKSTVAANLATMFARQGLRTGLLDADIYGPSIPTMFGSKQAEPSTGQDGKLQPIEAHGVLTLSIGNLSDPDAPMIWRGPIVMSAITQMLNDTAWGTPEDPLDLLIIDTPPGTGEAQLTLAQRVPVTAALLVTTPQDVALADVRRGAAMFAKTAVPVIGLVETMSWLEGPDGTRQHIFGNGGGVRMARDLGLPLLGQIPILQEVREGGDAGRPAALGDGDASDVFHAIARDVALSLDALKTKAAPAITFTDD